MKTKSRACVECTTEFTPVTNWQKYCSMACRNVVYVTAWRRRTKKRLLDAFGGKCVRCGYDRCMAALQFHHIRGKKKFGLSLTETRGWMKLLKEARKCVLLCSNCHAEVHHLNAERRWPETRSRSIPGGHA